MEIQEFLYLIGKKKQTIIIVLLLFVLCAVAFTFVQPLKYSSQSKVLVIQELPENVDPYQIAKSNEYVSTLLSEVISSNSFYREVLNSGFNVDKSYFPESGDKQMKLWRKTVKVSSNSSGIISITVYHQNRVQVDQINQAVNFILISKNQLYHGLGDSVKVKTIEQPTTLDRPVQPNIFVNIGVAVFFGLLLSLTYVYLFPEKQYNLRLVPSVDHGNLKLSANLQRTSEISQHISENHDKESPHQNETTLNVEGVYKRNNAPPADLPLIEEEEEDLVENLSGIEKKNYEIRGSMENILKQPGQRG